MHNIITNFDQILTFAKHLNVPLDKKRGILREYLQTKFIATLYSLDEAHKLSFVGGTSLRLLRNLNRFSEDLDFDNLGLTNDQVVNLVQEIVRRFRAEDLNVELRAQLKEGKTYFDLRFPELLTQLNVSSNPKEKLMIKFDYTNSWKNQTNEVVLLNKYGFIEKVVANKSDQSLVQKLTAYAYRKTTQPRDIYDTVWLYSIGARYDRDFALANNLENLLEIVNKKFKTEGLPENFKVKLAPFLFDTESLRKLDLFGSVLEDIT